MNNIFNQINIKAHQSRYANISGIISMIDQKIISIIAIGFIVVFI